MAACALYCYHFCFNAIMQYCKILQRGSDSQPCQRRWRWAGCSSAGPQPPKSPAQNVQGLSSWASNHTEQQSVGTPTNSYSHHTIGHIHAMHIPDVPCDDQLLLTIVRRPDQKAAVVEGLSLKQSKSPHPRYVAQLPQLNDSL